MKKALKSLFSSLGLFVARQFPRRVTGYDLERDLKEIIRKDKPLCFDIGANKGQTIQLLQSCFHDPTIHAFEPASATYQELTRQSFGPQVHLHPLAFGERPETARLRNYRHSELNSFLAINPDKQENFFAEVELLQIEPVQVDTIDRFCTRLGIRFIDLLKIDTQGFELPVLRGAADLLHRRQIGAVLLELNFSQLHEGQSDYIQLLSLLRSHGLRLIDFYEKERINGRELSWTTALFVQAWPSDTAPGHPPAR